jgi:hypothetical protein
MRKESRFLDDVTDSAAETDGIAVSGGAAFDEDLSLRGDEHAIDELEQSGFAAAAAAKENEGFAARNGQGNTGDYGAARNIVYVVAHATKFDGNVRRRCEIRIHFD